jgi:anaerobic selenocysteine-containing dehydrogenase
MDYRFSNAAREIEVYGFDRVVKSHCRGCHGGCGVLVYLKEGRIAKIAGDPQCPINHGTLCSQGLAQTQLVYHPDRLTHPMRRVAQKGSGRWERISWDEALDIIVKGSSTTRRTSAPNQSSSATEPAGKTRPSFTASPTCWAPRTC